jgi:hypothetical protein
LRLLWRDSGDLFDWRNRKQFLGFILDQRFKRSTHVRIARSLRIVRALARRIGESFAQSEILALVNTALFQLPLPEGEVVC